MPKHFPFPWFESILQSGDCNSKHIANLFDPTDGLYHDLQSAATTPAFSWISPNNCSDGHDAVCHGNNLSGGFSDPNTPNAPVNYTGGLYSADLFLEHVIPEIEASPAFKDGGLIDITFDEAFPPFTYTGNSFANSTIVRARRGDLDRRRLGRRDAVRPHASTGSRPARTRRWPTNERGEELYPGPGDNAYIDRPSNCVAQTVPSQPAGTCLLGGGEPRPRCRARTPERRRPSGSSTIADNSIVATDDGPHGDRHRHPGRRVRRPGHRHADHRDRSEPERRLRGHRLVHARGRLRRTARDDRARSAGSRSARGRRRPTRCIDATDPTTGGGDTGSVLISPYIKPGTVSNVYYNHYSWLRTMEDLFNVAARLAGPRRGGPHRLRGPARARAVRTRRVQQPRRPLRTSQLARTRRSLNLSSPAKRIASGQRVPIAAPPAEPAPPATASQGGARVFGLDPRRGARVAAGTLALVLVAALVGVLLSGHRASGAGRASAARRYGGIPSWLPKAKLPVGRVVRASRAHPALAIQGATVAVHLGGGRVLATAVGPSVPEEGRFPVPATSSCTFIVTFAAASSAIPLSPSAFTLIDDFGHVRHPRVRAIGGGAPPRQVLPGQTVSLRVHDVLPIGDGGLAWAPEGGRPIVSWDFDVEID